MKSWEKVGSKRMLKRVRKRTRLKIPGNYIVLYKNERWLKLKRQIKAGKVPNISGPQVHAQNLAFRHEFNQLPDAEKRDWQLRWERLRDQHKEDAKHREEDEKATNQ